MNANDAPELDETEYLLRSPRNAERLLAALAWSEAGEGVPQTIEALTIATGLNEERGLDVTTRTRIHIS